MFLAIVRWSPQNRITKFHPYQVESEALAHAAAHGGFVADIVQGTPIGHLLVDPVAETVSIDAPPPEPPHPVPAALEDLPDTVNSVPEIRSSINVILAHLRGD